MKIHQLFIAGVGSYLPPAVSVEDAVASGLYSAKEAEETKLESVLVSQDETPPDMAVHAARVALARSELQPKEIGLLLHASVYFQGLELYPTASYIHNAALGGHSALALEVKGVSNGGLASVELASGYLMASPDVTAAIVTTADKFCPPVVDRWGGDTGIVMGDGATAMILSRRKGFARLLSIATVSDPTLEKLHRGNAPFAAFSDNNKSVSVHERKRQYIEEVGLEDTVWRFQAGLRGSVDRALSDAGLKLSNMKRFVVPHVGYILLEREYLAALEIKLEDTTWAWARKLSHIGAGDQSTGIEHLMVTGQLKAGDHCMVMGVGAGFTWTCAVIEVLNVPSWAARPG